MHTAAIDGRISEAQARVDDYGAQLETLERETTERVRLDALGEHPYSEEDRQRDRAHRQEVETLESEAHQALEILRNERGKAERADARTEAAEMLNAASQARRDGEAALDRFAAAWNAAVDAMAELDRYHEANQSAGRKYTAAMERANGIPNQFPPANIYGFHVNDTVLKRTLAEQVAIRNGDPASAWRNAEHIEADSYVS